MQSFYVYIHSRLSSGEPFYVGKGRAGRAYSRGSRNAHWKSIVKKDGGHYVNFVAERLDEELALLLEIETIDKLRRLGAPIVNLTDGGDGVSGYVNPNGAHNKGKPCPAEMRSRISATLKSKGCLPPIGWNKGMKTPQAALDKKSASLIKYWARVKSEGGREISPETREKMRAAKLGSVKSEAARKKLSDALKANKYVRFKTNMLGYKHSAEARERMSAASRGRASAQRKRVICVDTGEIFDSAKHAAEHFGGAGHSMIAACCRGKYRTAYGYRFKYEND